MTLRQIPFLLLLAISPVSLYSQSTKETINKQIWHPFIKTYNTFDTEKFMSLYSKDIIRVPVDQRQIFDYTEYRRNINRENQFNKNYNIKASLEIRFTSRIHETSIAYESGILKIKLTDNTGKPATVYSKFQVIHKKENEVWKIYFDVDSSESSTITEKDFLKAEPLE